MIEENIKVEAIPEEDGGGYTAYIPKLGRYALVGDGDTPEEAIKSLKEIVKVMEEEKNGSNNETS